MYCLALLAIIETNFMALYTGYKRRVPGENGVGIEVERSKGRKSILEGVGFFPKWQGETES